MCKNKWMEWRQWFSNKKNQSRKHEAGFTLIEVMVVVGIIGILIAVALPRYQAYTKQARVSEGLNLSSAAKSVIATNANTGVSPLNTGVAAISATSSVQSVAVSDNGVITITYTTVVAPAGSNTLKLIPYTGSGSNKALLSSDSSGGNIQWQCAAAGISAIGGEAPGTLGIDLVPAPCRSDNP